MAAPPEYHSTGAIPKVGRWLKPSRRATAGHAAGECCIHAAPHIALEPTAPMVAFTHVAVRPSRGGSPRALGLARRASVGWWGLRGPGGLGAPWGDWGRLAPVPLGRGAGVPDAAGVCGARRPPRVAGPARRRAP